MQTIKITALIIALLALNPIGVFAAVSPYTLPHDLPIITDRSIAQPDVAFNVKGDGVVVWKTAEFSTRASLGEEELFVQRLQSDGSLVGSPILVSAADEGVIKAKPSVGIAMNGSFVVAWNERNIASGNARVVYQRFDSHGAKVDVNLSVEDSLTEQSEAVIGVSPNGTFLIAWVDSEPYESGSSNIKVKGFERSGAVSFDAVFVNDLTGGQNKTPQIAVASDEEFAIAWQGQDALLNQHIYARRYSSAGISKSDEIQVSEASPGSVNSMPDIAINKTGNIALTWICECDLGELSIQLHVLDRDNTAVFSQASIDQQAVNPRAAPQVALSDYDHVVLNWRAIDRELGKIRVLGQVVKIDDPLLQDYYEIAAFQGDMKEASFVSTMDVKGVHHMLWYEKGSDILRKNDTLGGQLKYSNAFGMTAFGDRTVNPAAGDVTLFVNNALANVKAVLWEQIAGNPVVLQSADQDLTMFTPPASDDLLSFKVTTEYLSGLSTSAEVHIAVDNTAPIIDAGENITGSESKGILALYPMSATAKSVSQEDIDFEWRQLSGPKVLQEPYISQHPYYPIVININTDVVYVYELSSRNTDVISQDIVVLKYKNVDFPMMFELELSQAFVNEGDSFQIQVMIIAYPGDLPRECVLRQVDESPYRIDLSSFNDLKAPNVSEDTILEFEYFCDNYLGETWAVRTSLLVENNRGVLPPLLGVPDSVYEGLLFRLTTSITVFPNYPFPSCELRQIDETPYQLDLTQGSLLQAPIVSEDVVLEFESFCENSLGETASTKASILIKNHLSPIQVELRISSDIVYEGQEFQLSPSILIFIGIPSPDCVTRQIDDSPYRLDVSAGGEFKAPYVAEDTVLEFEVFCENSVGDTASDTVSLMIENSPITLLIYMPEVVDENARILYQTGASSSNGVLLDCYWSQQLLGPSLLVDGNLNTHTPEVTSDTLVSLEYRCDDVLGGDFLTRIVQFTIRDVN